MKKRYHITPETITNRYRRGDKAILASSKEGDLEVVTIHAIHIQNKHFAYTVINSEGRFRKYMEKDLVDYVPDWWIRIRMWFSWLVM